MGHCLVGHKLRASGGCVSHERTVRISVQPVLVTGPEQETGPDGKVGMTLLISVL